MQKQRNKLYSELYQILNILGENYINQIPQNLYNLIDNIRDKDYMPDLLNEDGYLDETLISKETIALFAVLDMKYFIKDENVKKEYINTLNENEKNYQEELRQKYNPNEIFTKKVEKEIINIDDELQETAMVEYKKENFIVKLVNRIKAWFKNKK